jgi:hypothetical protein
MKGQKPLAQRLPEDLASMTDFVDQESCTLCSHIPPIAREAFRADLDTIPLNELTCEACLVAWWRNLPFSDDADDVTKH